MGHELVVQRAERLGFETVWTTERAGWHVRELYPTEDDHEALRTLVPTALDRFWRRMEELMGTEYSQVSLPRNDGGCGLCDRRAWVADALLVTYGCGYLLKLRSKATGHVVCEVTLPSGSLVWLTGDGSQDIETEYHPHNPDVPAATLLMFRP